MRIKLCIFIGTAADNEKDAEDMNEKAEQQAIPQPRKDYCGDNYIHADRFFLVASPCIFLIFNIIYWLSYGSQFYLAEHEMDDDEQSG